MAMPLYPVSNRSLSGFTWSAFIGASFLFSGCMHDANEAQENPRVEAASSRRAYFTATDYASGLLLSLNLDSLSRGPDSIEIFKDSRVIAHGGFVYVLESLLADNILKYDPVGQSVVYQKHLGKNLNPLDMDIINDTTALIAAENSHWLYWCNTRNGSLVDSLDLSQFIFKPDSGQGVAALSPHAFAVKVFGDSAVVGLQRRNGDWQKTGGMAQIAVIDWKTKSIRDTLISQSPNAAEMWVDERFIYLASQGAYGVPDDGGIYRWRRGDGERSTLLEGSEWNGDIGTISCNGDGRCLLAISPEWGKTDVFPMDLTTGDLSAALPGLKDASGGILYDSKSKRWVVGERESQSAGIVVFDSEFKPLSLKFPMALPPSSVSQVEFKPNR
jgi:hypothetical protein